MTPEELTLKHLPLVAAFIESGFVIGGVAMALGIRRMAPEAKKERTLKFVIYIIIVHVVAIAAFFGHPVFTIIYSGILLIGLFEMVRVSGRRKRIVFPVVATLLIYCILGIAGIVGAADSRPGRVLYCYLIIAVLDSYSQLAGQLFGRHKLAPEISPNKSVEGALGGTIAAIIASLVFHRLGGFSLVQAGLAGVLFSGIGVAGDLCASRFKRYCGVRNYSELLPGHGGFVDRFNSFIAVFPFFHLFCVLSVG